MLHVIHSKLFPDMSAFHKTALAHLIARSFNKTLLSGAESSAMGIQACWFNFQGMQFAWVN